MIRDILVPMTGTAGDDNAIAAALTLAQQEGAHVTVIEPVNLPSPTPDAWGLAPETVLNQVYNGIRATATGHAEQLRATLARHAVPSEVRLAESLYVDPERTAARYGRQADLLLMTTADDDAQLPVIRAYFSSLLLESGRPLLLMPAKHLLQWPPSHVVVAWAPTKEAARAVHDALPLLLRAQSVDVLEVGPPHDEVGQAADLVAHLARHGLSARAVAHELLRGEAVTTVLLRHCDRTQAQLLVAGGYGHSRFREWVLGGVTRDLMRFAHLPVLFSH